MKIQENTKSTLGVNKKKKTNIDLTLNETIHDSNKSKYSYQSIVTHKYFDFKRIEMKSFCKFLDKITVDYQKDLSENLMRFLDNKINLNKDKLKKFVHLSLKSKKDIGNANINIFNICFIKQNSPKTLHINI